MKTNAMTTSQATIAMQEDAMWTEYYVQRSEELDSSFYSDVDLLPESERSAALDFLNGDSSVDVDHEDAYAAEFFSEYVTCRSDITLSGPPRIYPDGKVVRHTSKRRRYDKPKRNLSSRIHGNP